MREKGSSEVLNKLYDTAMDKLEGVKKEYDALSKRYSEKVANHNTDLSRLEQAEEENRRLQKQMDALLKQRDSAMHYQQQYSTSMRRWKHLSPARIQRTKHLRWSWALLYSRENNIILICNEYCGSSLCWFHRIESGTSAGRSCTLIYQLFVSASNQTVH